MQFTSGYTLIKYVWFMSTYFGRGCFYIFLGSCFIGGGFMGMGNIIAALLFAVGFFTICVSLLRGNLPTYGDATIRAREEERLAHFKKRGRRPSQTPMAQPEMTPASSAAPLQHADVPPVAGSRHAEPNPFHQDAYEAAYAPTGGPARGVQGASADDDLEKMYAQMRKGQPRAD
eukprot:Hpha_TRINITY_DN16050_c2_g7::TRINITY_DN16050_c2_g7_i3::g.121557::m.121557